MKKSKLINMTIIISSIVLLLIVVGVIYFSNNSFAAPSNIEIKDITKNDFAKINFTDVNTATTANFNVTIVPNSSMKFFNKITFTPTFILGNMKSKSIVLQLERSNDNVTFTEVTKKQITEASINQELVYIDSEEQTQTIRYYRFKVFVDNVEQDIKNNNVSGKIDVRTIISTYAKITYIIPVGDGSNAIQEWIAPVAGKYMIELWGAQGNYYDNKGGKPNTGYGAYTAGIISLAAGEKLYFNIGRGGNSGNIYATATYDGGGAGAGYNTNQYKSTVHFSGAGGGASDVRTVRGYWYDRASLASRIMVAAGGGGSEDAYYSTSHRESWNVEGLGWQFGPSILDSINEASPSCSGYGGSGGGLVGYNGGTLNSKLSASQNESMGAQGGKQSSGGAQAPYGASTNSGNPGAFGSGGASRAGINCPFEGIGSDRTPGSDCGIQGGGGGGWFGGSAGSIRIYGDNNDQYHTGGAGGSSYISGHTGSIGVNVSGTPKCSESGTTSIPATYVGTTDNECSISNTDKTFTNTVMIDGNGYSWTNVRGEQNPMPNVNGGTNPIGTGNSGNGVGRVTLTEATETKSEAESVWQKTENKRNLIVKHQDITGTDLTDPTSEEKVVGDDYTSSSKTFDGYKLYKVPTNASGIMPDSDLTLIYYYIEQPHIDITTTISRNDGGWIDSTVSLKNTSKFNACGLTLVIPVDERLTNIREVTMSPSDVASYVVKNNRIYVTFLEQFKANDEFTITYKTDEVKGKGGNLINIDPVIEYYPGAKDMCPAELNKDEFKFTGTAHDDEKIPVKIIVHHYLEGTTQKIAEDEEINTFKGESYTTNPVDSPDYTLVKTPANASGVAHDEEIEVIYEYNSTKVEIGKHELTKTTETEKITDEEQLIDYKITYSGIVKVYKGDATLTVVDKLPYEIDESKSDLGTGTYDKNNKIITWVKDIKSINTYVNGEFEITFEANIKLVYIDYDLSDPYAKNVVESTLHFDATDEDITRTSTVEIPVEIPGEPVITIPVDPEDNPIPEIPGDTQCVGMFSGRICSVVCSPFAGYELISTNPEDYTITDKQQERKCVYKKIKNPFTGDAKFAPYVVLGFGALSVIGAATYYLIKTRKRTSE